MAMALSAAALGGYVIVGLDDCQLVLTDDAHAGLLEGRPRRRSGRRRVVGLGRDQ
jgi:hypothetical protein